MGSLSATALQCIRLMELEPGLGVCGCYATWRARASRQTLKSCHLPYDLVVAWRSGKQHRSCYRNIVKESVEALLLRVPQLGIPLTRSPRSMLRLGSWTPPR